MEKDFLSFFLSQSSSFSFNCFSWQRSRETLTTLQSRSITRKNRNVSSISDWLSNCAMNVDITLWLSVDCWYWNERLLRVHRLCFSRELTRAGEITIRLSLGLFMIKIGDDQIKKRGISFFLICEKSTDKQLKRRRLDDLLSFSRSKQWLFESINDVAHSQTKCTDMSSLNSGAAEWFLGWGGSSPFNDFWGGSIEFFVSFCWEKTIC